MQLVNYVVVLMIQMLAPDRILERAYYNHVPTLDVIVLTPITSSRTRYRMTAGQWLITTRSP